MHVIYSLINTLQVMVNVYLQTPETRRQFAQLHSPTLQKVERKWRLIVECVGNFEESKESRNMNMHDLRNILEERDRRVTFIFDLVVAY
jgi:hypothetical protein